MTWAMPDPVSVIVTTRNSARTIEACLRSVRRQTHPSIELIVVDNASTDGTREIARELADVVLVAGPERSAQRNRGADRASGAHLLVIDSDMTLEPDVVAEAVCAVRGGVGSVVIPERSFGEGFWSRVKELERSCYVCDDSVEAARFFPRDTFDSVGGYDDEGIPAGPEDWDLHARVRHLGRPVGRTQARIWHDEGRLGLRETMATKHYYGKTAGAYIRRHPELAGRQLRVLRPAFLRHWRRLARRPGLAAAMLVMKSLEMGAGAAGLLGAELRGRRRAAR